MDFIFQGPTNLPIPGSAVLNNGMSIMFNWPHFDVIISPNEVFGDIMVLASPRPPVDPDDANTLTRQIFNLSLSNFI